MLIIKGKELVKGHLIALSEFSILDQMDYIPDVEGTAGVISATD